jgi:two-component system cell cycle response regulator
MGEDPGDFDGGSTRVTNLADLQKAASTKKRPFLLLLSGTEVGRTFELPLFGESVIGRSSSTDIHLDDDTISRRHACIRCAGDIVRLDDLESANGTWVNGERISEQRLHEGDKIRLGDGTLMRYTIQDSVDESFQQVMYDLALRDGLTKTYNREHFAGHLNKEVAFARRHGTPLSLLMLDIDHFKRVNDTYGHLAGDQVLVELAERVQVVIRTEDTLARYGGEEFAVVLRGIELDNATIVGERVRALVANKPFDYKEQSLAITTSVGAASFGDYAHDPESLVRAADEALYAAKGSGRNCVLLNEKSRLRAKS